MVGSALEPGTLLNERYIVTGLIGVGGFAEVYEAYDKMIERQVAAKVLFPLDGHGDAQSTSSKVERFMQEAKAAAAIAHPNVVTIYDMGFHEGSRPFIVMELLHGHDLKQELSRNGPLRPQRFLPLFDKALDALAAGHRRGIIHRDLKPENLFLVSPLEAQEDIRLLDFGVAKLTSVGASMTTTGEMYGTAAYLAPEYILNATVTPALDVYQMGLILVELLTGETVVGGDNPLACIARHSSGNLSVPLELLRSPLGPIITKSLVMDHEARYPDAGALRDALRQIDPAHIPSVTPSGHSLQVREVSSSMRAVSGMVPGDTGTFSQNMANARTPAQLGASGSAERVLVGALASAQPFSGQMSTPLPKPSAPSIAVAPPEGEKDASGFSVLRLVLIVVVLAVCLAVGVAIALNTHEGEGDAVEPRASQGPAPVKKAPEVPKEVAPVVDEAPPEPSDKDLPEIEITPAVDVEVEIVTSPKGTRIYSKEGKKLGKAPMTWTFEAGDMEPVVFQIRRMGYKSVEVSVSPNDGPRKDVILKKLPKGKGGGMGLAD